LTLWVDIVLNGFGAFRAPFVAIEFVVPLDRGNVILTFGLRLERMYY
jgi:hypothetical protein